jgi:hypothetical protein
MVLLNTGIVMFAHTNVQEVLDHHSSLSHSAIHKLLMHQLLPMNGMLALLNPLLLVLLHVLLVMDLL